MTRLSLALGAAWLGLSAGPLRAELTCPQAAHDAGERRSGLPLVHRFAVVNGGATPAVVREARPGCGCLRPTLDATTVPPGGTAHVTVEVNTVTEPAGPNRWRVVLRYAQDGRERELPLEVTATVVREVSASPANLLLHTSAGRPLAHHFTLTDRRARPLEVRSAQTTCPHVIARAGEARRSADGAGWERTVLVEVSPACPEGRHEGLVRLLSDDPLYRQITLPFTVLCRAAAGVTAVPGAVSLVGARGAALPARVVQLGSADESPVEVAGVECDHPAVRCQWLAGPGPRTTLKVLVDGARLSGDELTAVVRVRLNRPAAQTVTIPVRCTLR